MNQRRFWLSPMLLILLGSASWSDTSPDWGFYAHRKIHYYAVMTIPPPLNQFFKTYVEYLRTHAVDPDRRRYAVSGEGPRHFIDLDRWIKNDSLTLTRNYAVDRILHGMWMWEDHQGKRSVHPVSSKEGRFYFDEPAKVDIDSFALSQELGWTYSPEELLISPFLYPDAPEGKLRYVDTFSIYGNLPYHFTVQYRWLVEAMKAGDLPQILRLCNDLGHYMADAHVPLHTTENYNGQLTDQLGIHAFWESRIPELFEEDHFDAWAGRAEYISDIEDFIWEVVFSSHSLVEEVLAMEREAKSRVEVQNHYCYEERGNQMVRTQCPELAREYMKLMRGMVEDRYRKAIHSVGSVWYSAWLDAGSPELWDSFLLDIELTENNGSEDPIPILPEDSRSRIH